jgi:hypothetical protein
MRLDHKEIWTTIKACKGDLNQAAVALARKLNKPTTEIARIMRAVVLGDKA